MRAQTATGQAGASAINPGPAPPINPGPAPPNSPAELAAILADRPDRSIERLDICDHGGSGFITLGGNTLFLSDRDPESPLVSAALAVGFRDKLSATAQVRLLGCETGGAWGHHREGRLLLIKLAQLLNQDTNPRTNRVVFGTIVGVQPADFDEQGFLHTGALTMLFSSCAALDHDAPVYDDRLGHVATLHGELELEQPPSPLEVKRERGARHARLRRAARPSPRVGKRVQSGSR